MSLNEKLTQKLKQYLSKNPTEQELRLFLDSLLEDQVPSQAFHQTNVSQIKEPTLFFTQLMVQDMRQSSFFYPFAIQRPFSQKSHSIIFNYGCNDAQINMEQIQSSKYFTELRDQQIIYCTTVVGETEWVKSLEKNQLPYQFAIQMINCKIGAFKLGEVFSSICVYHPENKLLYFVRKCKQEQINKWTNTNDYLEKQIEIQKTREQLFQFFANIYEKKYCQFLLYSLISTDYFFISAAENHGQIFRLLVPRLVQIKIKAPFKQSLFPYKNQQQILIKTKMQMSQNHTYVIIDFSQFSNDKQIKIGPEQIDNLKALKVFVEEGNTIYRWIFGESLLKHQHTGLVVKASSIINPQYIILQNKKNQISQIPIISEPDLRKFRSYIHQVRKINPFLKQDKNLIEEKIHSKVISFDEQSLVKIMELSKLRARSFGRDQIKIQDFINSYEIYF